jgi:ABC-type branched-subunit amino acid transport system ATPase component
MIDIKNLTLGYSSHVVLEKFSAHISAASITAIVGSNGAGKSSLLSAIAGALTPISGSISIDGKEIATLSPKELAGIRAVAQQSHSYWMAYSVAQILRLGHEGIAASRIDEVAKSFGISDILPQSITALSGGQLQRVEIARAFMRDLPLVLLDEPFASQDLASQEGLINRFQEERRCGKTIVFVAHRERSSLAWCDQIIDLGQ